MRDEEALQICREAARGADKAGVDRNALDQELEAKTETDPKVDEAFTKLGFMLLAAQQETKH